MKGGLSLSPNEVQALKRLVGYLEDEELKHLEEGLSDQAVKKLEAAHTGKELLEAVESFREADHRYARWHTAYWVMLLKAAVERGK